MTRSESINELAAALAKAQGEILNAKKDAENPHFRSKYADLGSVWDAIRAALTKHGLAVVQSPRLITSSEKVWFVEIETTMFHASGQLLSDVLAMPLPSPTPQGIGSACTYARRYALAAFAGVAAAGEDDDGQAASESVDYATGEIKRAEKPAPRPPALTFISVTVKVVKIVKRPLKDDPVREKFIITGDDKANYHTFSITHATAAKSAQEAGIAVDITYKDTQYGRLIQSLKEHDETPAEEPPL